MSATPLGIRLMLLVGDSVPRPASADLMAAITQVQVNTSDELGDGFQLTLSLSKGLLLDYPLLQGGELGLFKRVIVAVVLGLMPEVLIDGVITNHQLSPSSEPGQSTLSVTGTGLATLMDLEESSVPYDNQSSSMIVTRILSAYARYGIAPAVTPTSDTKLNVDGTPWQRETDLACIERLAADNGFVFYLEPQAIGSSLAYWGPRQRSGALQPALTLGLGPADNLSSLGFSQEGLAAASVKASYLEPQSKTTIALPPLPPLRVPPLALLPTPSRKVRLLRDTANKAAADALQAMAAALGRQPDTVDGHGELDSARYGHVLRARRLVGVRGAGMTYDGVYSVRSVSHRIARGDYRQSFALSREGTGALTRMVMA